MASDSPMPLYLFAKAPVPGKVKTRMRTHLSDESCAELATEMLFHSVEKITDYWPGFLVLCVTPSCDDPSFHEILRRYGCGIALQIEADLGGRMMHALEQGISASGAAVVMGCDVPQIPARILNQAYAYLQAGENVIGPAEDGGFYLLGLKSHCPALFEGISWGGGSHVLDEVLLRSEHARMSMKKLQALRDIDRWEDLKWLAARDRRYAQYLKNKSHA